MVETFGTIPQEHRLLRRVREWKARRGDLRGRLFL
jgi:hypothetical protein